MVSAFWSGRRVFVTGHTGFKGSWLTLWLRRLGAEVTGYALPPPTTPSLYVQVQAGTGVRSIVGDVRDLVALEVAVRTADPEVVFHLAAQPIVHEGYREPVSTYATNVMGTVHVLEAIRRTPGVRALVNVTTDKCYENQEWVWGYRESDRLGGGDPYASSKACSELVTQAYRSAYFDAGGEAPVAVATARAGNVIGGGDWAADRLVPDLVRAIEAHHPISIRRPEAVRPWQHVLEPLRGYMLLAERLFAEGSCCAEAWNFGPDPDDAWPVQRVVTEFLRRWPGVPAWKVDAGVHSPETHYLALDCAKARSVLDWKPRLPLTEALDWTAAWYRACVDGRNLRACCLEQIAAYEALSA